MKKQQVLSIDYFDKFECIGDKCEDHCCKNWNIDIDKKTYMKYKKLQQSEFKNKLVNSIGRNRQSKSDYNYAKIKLVNGMCSMLSKDGLCDVYSNIGPQNMCYTCKVYPRYYNQVDSVLESSLTLSCIEVARNILLRENPIEFNLDIKEIDEVRIDKGIVTIETKKLRKKYFNDIRIFCIGLIQNRKYSIEERLVILGLFIKNLNDITEESLILYSS